MQVNLNKTLLSIGGCAAALVLLTGCGPNDFNYGKARGIIEGTPLRVDSEYVMLSQQQYDCGLTEDLWDPPSPPVTLPGQTGTARVTARGKALNFSDDVMIGDKRYPYVQVRGDFTMAVTEISNDKAGPEEFTRLVETKLGVVINHSCFQTPLPMMGVRKGQFTQDYSPVLLFRYSNGWSIDKFVHN